MKYAQRTVELGKRSNHFGEDDVTLKKEFDCFLLSTLWKGRVVVELTGLDNATVLNHYAMKAIWVKPDRLVFATQHTDLTIVPCHQLFLASDQLVKHAYQ